MSGRLCRFVAFVVSFGFAVLVSLGSDDACPRPLVPRAAFRVGFPRHRVYVSIPMTGHLSPLFRLAGRRHRAGDTATLITTHDGESSALNVAREHQFPMDRIIFLPACLNVTIDTFRRDVSSMTWQTGWMERLRIQGAVRGWLFNMRTCMRPGLRAMVDELDGPDVEWVVDSATFAGNDVLPASRTRVIFTTLMSHVPLSLKRSHHPWYQTSPIPLLVETQRHGPLPAVASVVVRVVGYGMNWVNGIFADETTCLWSAANRVDVLTDATYDSIPPAAALWPSVSVLRPPAVVSSSPDTGGVNRDEEMTEMILDSSKSLWRSSVPALLSYVKKQSLGNHTATPAEFSVNNRVTQWLALLPEMPVVVINFGTLASWEEPVYRPAVWKRLKQWIGYFEKLGWRVLLKSSRVTSATRTFLAVCWMDKFQETVMASPSVKIIWSHCGQNLATEALAHKKWLYCTPEALGTDQWDMSYQLQTAGLASVIHLVEPMTEF